jgi:uncharacterized membrane protein
MKSALHMTGLDRNGKAPNRADRRADRIARGLGLASLGLGVAHLAAPNWVAWASGTENTPRSRMIIPAVGIRELGHAAALLGARRPGKWTWTRVAGDAMDLAVLGRALMSARGPRKVRTVAATAAVVGITAADLYTSIKATRSGEMGSRGGAIHIESGITINKSPAEVYRFWRDFENWPRFMYHLQSVRVSGDRQSHWAVNGPAMKTIEWDAEIVEDTPDRLIAWRSLPGAMVPNWGQVRFVPAPGGRGTEVRVELDYAPPAGAFGAVVAKLFGEEPRQQVSDDLRRFKQVIETGEVVRSEGSPQGLSVHRQVKQRVAQPLPDERMVPA